MFSKHLRFVTVGSLFISAFVSLPSAMAGSGTSGGGSLVEVDGKFEPADLHYTGSPDVIPSSYVPVDFKNYSQAVEALQYAAAFLKMRDRGSRFSEWDFDNTEFYFVPSLSGQDLSPVETGLAEQQVSYTRDIVDPTNSPVIRSIVEIRQPLFDRLTPENQALILLHELMHHKPYGQHPVISPVIKSLSVLLPLMRREVGGERVRFSDAEYAQDQILEKIMSAIYGEEPRGVTRNGGGLTSAGPADEQSYIDLGSSLEGWYTEKNTANTVIRSHIRLNCPQVQGNQFVDSVVDFVCYASGDNPRRAIIGNSFQNVHIGELNLKFFQSFSGNILKDVDTGGIGKVDISGLRNHRSSDIQDNRLEDVQTANRWTFIQGSRNRLAHLKAEGSMNSMIYIEGDDNKLEDIAFKRFSQGLVLYGSGTEVTRFTLSSGVDEPSYDVGGFRIDGEVRIENSSYVGVSACRIQPGTVIKNQAISSGQCSSK